MDTKFLYQSTILLLLTIAVKLGFTNHKPDFPQLTPDNHLGAENSIVTPEKLRNLIQGGAIRGNKYSVSQF